MLKYLTYLLIILILQLFMGCSSKHIKTSDELYYDIGGKEKIEQLVNAFVHKIAQDKNILPYFAKSSVTHFKQGFTNHLCAVMNGPCKYDGDNMRDIHTGMNINESDFNRIVELLVQAMEDVDIPYQSQNKLLLKLAVLRKQIIKI